jgi:hypothetical protein
MKVERIEKAEAAKAPADVKLRLELKAARATIRVLKRQVKAERAHATAMVNAMAEMGRRAWAALQRDCTCVPARSDMFRR